jgi:outer membrane receptor protein involved in Fe transport
MPWSTARSAASLPGGRIGWAFGGQYREINYETWLDNPLIDSRVTPCPEVGDTSCTIADYSAVGYTNYERFPGTISEWRALGYLNYNLEDWNFRWEVRYVSGVDDDRDNPFVYDANGELVEITWGEKVDDYYSNNLYVNWQAPWDLKVGLSVINVFDEDPSKARHQLGYDPYIGDPLGRTIELSLKKTFSGD